MGGCSLWINCRFVLCGKKNCQNDKCVFVLGGFSAAVTTPLDVVKTRIMLADRKDVKSGSLTFSKTFKKVLKKEGVKG